VIVLEALETRVVVVALFSVVVTIMDGVLRELFTNPRPTEAPMTPKAMIAARAMEIITLLEELMVYSKMGMIL